MKFKGAVIGILAAILAVNVITAGILIKEVKQQTEMQREFQTIIIETEKLKVYREELELNKDDFITMIEDIYNAGLHYK